MRPPGKASTLDGMRTLSITLLAGVLALAGCEKTIHEASRTPAAPRPPATLEHAPAIVPAVDGVPIA